MMRWRLLLISLLCIGFAAQAQRSAPYKTLSFKSSSDSVLIDSGTIVQSSVLVYAGDSLLQAGVHYRINYSSNYFIPLQIPRETSVSISYQTLNINLKQTYYNKPRSLQLPQLNGNREEYGYAPGSGNSFDLYKNDGLKMNGSISRGLGFGNNQSIVLNSNLNLQMAGRINNDIDVLAAISDDNNPIQPEGNTQQLQDFDRVYVQLSKDNTTLTVGDFEMLRPDGAYFMNYLKKSRGIQATTNIKAGKQGILKVGGEGALSRGRFARNIINGIEGNQGPYRLSGPNGELYIIVISGTEAVYLDGQKLTRGEQNDYTIDYNTGEVTFMPKRPITQYSRIIVEFQFSDKNYARSVFHVQTAYENKGMKLMVNYFTEQDNKDQPFLQNLTDSSKRILANVGDRLNEAVMSSEVKTSFDSKKILYLKKDTLAFQGIYVYAPQQGTDSVFYEVRFSLVGQGKGNYRQTASNANGRVYTWVQPVNGIPQGDYEPVMQLVSPKRRQMLTVGTTFKAGKNTDVFIELATTNNDINTFSEKDKNNDVGYGVRTNVNNKLALTTKRDSSSWQLNTAVSYEYVDQNFRYVERYRGVEFDRTWNRLLTNTSTTTDTGYQEHIASWRSTIQQGKAFSLFYQASFYNRQQVLNGLQHQTGFFLNKRNNFLTADAEWVTTTDKTNRQPGSEVARYRAEYSRMFTSLMSGVKVESEQSLFKKNSDTILTGSYGFQQYGWYIKNIDTTSLRYKLEYTQRIDLLPTINALTTSTVGQNLNASTEWVQKNGNRLSGNVTYREFNVRNNALTSVKPERTILSRIEYDYSFLRRVIVANTYYQVGSGQELRRDYQYVEVLVGQGQYVWKDFNENGKQELNEFLLASATDKPQANYIKVFLPTNSFISTHTNQFNQTLNINPAAVWGNKKGVRKALAKFSNLSALKLDRKTQRLATADFLNPFKLNVNDTSLISLNSLFRNTLFFNRSNPTFGADWSYQNQRSKTFLTNGFETRNRNENTCNLRWNVTASWSITSAIGSGVRSYSSDFFTENNYQYSYVEAKPKLSYQATTQVRLTAVVGYFEGTNIVRLGGEKAKTEELGMELRYSLKKQGVINAKFSNYTIQYNGAAQNPLGYDMLQGLAVGKNAVWNISFQQRLGSSLQITITYDGRSAENQRTIHIGRMEARYLF